MPTKKSCPFCTSEIPATAIICDHCGRDLQSVRIARSNAKSNIYEIVRDGVSFGIALRGKVIIHGMRLEEARSTVEILNSVTEPAEAG